VKVTHSVADGTVYCAQQRRIVDVMACYGCDRVVEIDLDSRRPKVTCAASAPGEPAPAAT
jgi:hypothetical protein